MTGTRATEIFDGRRTLVTGAGGFSGRRVCIELLARGAEVVALARREPEIPEHDRLNVVVADLCATPVLPGPFDAAVHCAATSPARGVSDADIMRDNVDGGRCLLDRLLEAGCARMIFLSSLSVHGDITEPVVTPDTPFRNPDAYGQSKRALEEMLAAAAQTMPAVAIRLPGIVGPGAQRNWLTRVKAAALAGEDIVIFNPDAPYNNIVHVDDLVAFICTLVAGELSGFSAFPVGSAGRTTVRGAIETMIAASGSHSSVTVRTSDRQSFTIDNTMAEGLGYRPGNIRDVVAHYAGECGR